MVSGLRALRDETLGLAQRTPSGLALGGEDVEALARHTDLLVESHHLFGRLAKLHAHLLTTLEESLEVRLDFLYTLAQIGEPVIAHLDRLALGGLMAGQPAHRRAENLFALMVLSDLELQAVGLGHESGEIGGGQHEGTVSALLFERLVLLSALGLALERAELALDLVHHVLHTNQVSTGAVELSLRLAALLLVACDAGRFLDEHATLVRLGGQDMVELVLVHHRIRTRVGAGPGEEVENVAQPGRLLVEEVLALTRPVEPPRHGDFAPRHGQNAIVGEPQLDFGQADGLAGRRAVEDDVVHALATE